MLDVFKSISIFFLIFIFCTNTYEALESLFFPEIKEMIWYFLLFSITILVFMLRPIESTAQFPIAAFIWIILFIITIITSYSVSTQSQLVNRTVINLLKSLSVFISMFILITDRKTLKVAFYSCLFVLLAIVFINTYDFLNDSVQWSSIAGRAAGWFHDPNIAGRNIVMSLLLSSLIISKRFLWPVIIVASFGIVLTFSRGSWLMLFIVIIGISFFRAKGQDKRFTFLDIKPITFFMMLAGIALGSLFLSLFISGQAYQIVKNTPLEDYLSKDTISRLSGDFSDGSITSRKKVLVAALKMGKENPVVGAGLASTHEWEYDLAPHNDYATLFAERGALGVIVYFYLLGIIWFSGNGYSKLFALILAFSSITSHMTLEQPATYIFIALVMLLQKHWLIDEKQH